MNDFQFVIDWKTKGDNEKDTINKFFCYYIAFNWLYNKEYENCEYKRVIAFIKDYLSHNALYNPLAFCKSDEWKRNVRDPRNGKVKKYIIEENDKTIKLFLLIYQIRCNLFHGSKWMISKRDNDLVRESVDVLQDLLQRIIGDE